jgi:hypothetical protein
MMMMMNIVVLFHEKQQAYKSDKQVGLPEEKKEVERIHKKPCTLNILQTTDSVQGNTGILTRYAC